MLSQAGRTRSCDRSDNPWNDGVVVVSLVIVASAQPRHTYRREGLPPSLGGLGTFAVSDWVDRMHRYAVCAA